MRLGTSSLGIEFSQHVSSKPFLTSNDRIEGDIVFNCPSETNVNDVTITFEAVESVTARVYYRAGNQSNYRRVTNTAIYPIHKEVLFPDRSIAPAQGHYTIKAGTHRFPFSVPIPTNIPSSVFPLAHNTRVVHRIKAHVDRPSHVDNREKAYITVYPIREQLSFPLALVSSGEILNTIQGRLPGAKNGIGSLFDSKHKAKFNVCAQVMYPRRILQNVSHPGVQLFVKAEQANIFRVCKIEASISEYVLLEVKRTLALLSIETERLHYLRSQLERTVDIPLTSESYIDLSPEINKWLIHGCLETQKLKHMRAEHFVRIRVTFDSIHKPGTKKHISIESPCTVLSPGYSAVLPQTPETIVTPGSNPSDPHAKTYEAPPAYDGPIFDTKFDGEDADEKD